MKLIITCLAICAVCLVFTVVWAIAKQHRRTDDELAVVAEIPETGFFGVALVILGFWMLIGKLMGEPFGGTDSASFTFIAIFGAVLTLAGCEVLLMSFVKRTIAYADQITSYNSFGKTTSIPWKSVTAVKVPLLSRNATFVSKQGSVSVNGRREEYVKLVNVAIKQVPPAVASDDLGRLLRRLQK